MPEAVDEARQKEDGREESGRAWLRGYQRNEGKGGEEVLRFREHCQEDGGGEQQEPAQFLASFVAQLGGGREQETKQRRCVHEEAIEESYVYDVAEKEQEGGGEERPPEGSELGEAGLDDAEGEKEKGAVNATEETAIEVFLSRHPMEKKGGLDGEMGRGEEAAVPPLFGEKLMDLGGEVKLIFVRREERVVQGDFAVVAVVGEADDRWHKEDAGENACGNEKGKGAKAIH